MHVGRDDVRLDNKSGMLEDVYYVILKSLMDNEAFQDAVEILRYLEEVDGLIPRKHSLVNVVETVHRLRSPGLRA